MGINTNDQCCLILNLQDDTFILALRRDEDKKMTMLREIRMFLVMVVMISAMIAPNVSAVPMYVGRKADIVVSGADIVVSGADVVVSCADIVVSAADIVVSGAYIVVSGADIVVSGADIVVSGADIVVSVADIVVSGADIVVSGADIVVSVADIVVSAADIVVSAAWFWIRIRQLLFSTGNNDLNSMVPCKYVHIYTFCKITYKLLKLRAK